MKCPVCGTEYASFETKCALCNADLVDDQAEDAAAAEGTPDTKVVSVFKTSDPAVLPLATMALEGEGIEFLIKTAGKADSLQWMMSQDPTNRPMAVEIHVASDVATKARDLLVDLENLPPDSPGSPEFPEWPDSPSADSDDPT